MVDVLNDLLESARDGEYGFHACAEHARVGPAQGIFSATRVNAPLPLSSWSMRSAA